MIKNRSMSKTPTIASSKEGASGVWSVPELSLILFAFLLNFVWEFWQVPFFAGIQDAPHWQAIKVCTRATFGDVAIIMAAYWAAAAFAKNRLWLMRPSKFNLAIFLSLGVVITIFIEHYSITTGRWEYADIMPIIPIIGVGVSPLLQWIIVPLLTLNLSRRMIG